MMAFIPDDKTALRASTAASSSYQPMLQFQQQQQHPLLLYHNPYHHSSYQQHLGLPVYSAQPTVTSSTITTPIDHQFYTDSSNSNARMQQHQHQQNAEQELRQRLVVAINELQQEQEKCHQEVLKNKRTTEMYNRLCEKYHGYRQTMDERDDVLRKLEIAETTLDQCQTKCQRYESQNRENQHTVATLRSEIQSAMKERDQFRLQCGEKDEALRKLGYNMLTGQSVQELEHLRAAVQRWQTERHVFFNERQDLHDQVKNAQQGRQLAFDLRETAVKERESMSAMCDQVRRDRDEHILKLAEALRQLDELKRKQQEAVRRAANAQERVEVLQRENCMLHWKQQQLSTSTSSSQQRNPTDSCDSAISSTEFGQSQSDDSASIVHYQTKEIDVDLTSGKFEKFEDFGLNLRFVPKIPDDGSISVVYVQSIDESSPFRFAGLRANDRVVRIENNLLAGASISSVASYILQQARDYNHITFLVKRRVAAPQPIARVLDVVVSSKIGFELDTSVLVTRIEQKEDSAADDDEQTQQRLMLGDRILAVDGDEIDVNQMEFGDAAKLVTEQIQLHAGTSVNLRVSRFMPSCDDAVAQRKRYILSNTVQYAEKAVQTDSGEEINVNCSCPVTPTNDKLDANFDKINDSYMPTKSYAAQHVKHPSASSEQSNSSSTATTKAVSNNDSSTSYEQQQKHRAFTVPPKVNSRYTTNTDPMAAFFAPTVDQTYPLDDGEDEEAPLGLLPAKKSLFERVFGGGNDEEVVSTTHKMRRASKDVDACGDQTSEVMPSANYDRSKQRRHTMFYVATPNNNGDGFDDGTQQQVAEVDDALSALDDVIVQHAKTTTRKVVGDNLYDAPPSRRNNTRPLTISQFHSASPVNENQHARTLAQRYDDIMGGSRPTSDTQHNQHHFFTTRRGQARKLAAAVRAQSPNSLLGGAGSKCDTNSTIGGAAGCSKPSILSKAKKFLRKVSDKVPGNSNNNNASFHNKRLPTTTTAVVDSSTRIKLRRGSYNQHTEQPSSSCGSSGLADEDYLYENGAATANNNNADGGTWPRERHMRALTTAFAIDTDSEAYAMAAAAAASNNMDELQRLPWQQQQHPVGQQFAMMNDSNRPFSISAPLAWSEYLASINSPSYNPRSGPMSRKRAPLLPAHHQYSNDAPNYYFTGGGGGEQRARTLPRFSTPPTNHHSMYGNNMPYVASNNSNNTAYTPVSWMPPQTRSTLPLPAPHRMYSAGGISSASSSAAACREFQYASNGSSNTATNNAVVSAYTSMPNQQPPVDLQNAAGQWSSTAVADAPASTNARQFCEGLYDVLPSSSTVAASYQHQQPLYDVLPLRIQRDEFIPTAKFGGGFLMPTSMERIQQQVRKQKPPPAGIRTINIQRPPPAISRSSSVSTNTQTGGAPPSSKTHQPHTPLGIEVDEVELSTPNAGYERAVLIVNVARDSPSERAGLCIGDQLLDLNGLNLRSTNKPDLGIVRNILSVIVTDGEEETVNMKVQYRGADVLRSATTTNNNDKTYNAEEKRLEISPKVATKSKNRVKTATKPHSSSLSASKHQQQRQHPTLQAVFSDSLTKQQSNAAAPAKPLRRAAAPNPAAKTSHDFSSSALPHVCPPKSDEDVRTIVVQKAQNENIGITLIGGNVLGIFVHTIAVDSPVRRGQVISRSSTSRKADDDADDALPPSNNDHEPVLKAGDQILQYNNTSLLQATAEQALPEVSKPASRIEFVVQHHPQRYALALERPGDAFYVRALFDYRGTSEEEVSFRRGQVLLIDCTVWKGSVGKWRAWLLDERGEKKDYGLIPNRYRAEEAVVAQRRSRKQDSMDSNDSMTKRWSVFVRRKRSAASTSSGAAAGPSSHQMGSFLSPSSTLPYNSPSSMSKNNIADFGADAGKKNSVGKASKLFSSSSSATNNNRMSAAREILSITFDDMTLTDSNDDENNNRGDDDDIVTNRNNAMASADAAQDSATPVAAAEKLHIFPTYQRVVRVDYAEKRPVVLLGPLSEQISNLLVEYPVFAHCPFEMLQQSVNGDDTTDIDRQFDADDIVIEKRYRNNNSSSNERQRHVEAIMASVVRDICAKNYHCLLVPSSTSQLDAAEIMIERLRQAHFFPIVILVQFKSSKLLKEALTCVSSSSSNNSSTPAAALLSHSASSAALASRQLFPDKLSLVPSPSSSSTTEFANKVAPKVESTTRELYDRSVQMEADLKSCITAVVRTTNFKFAVLQIKEVVDKEQRKALWIPHEDAKVGGGSGRNDKL